MKVRHSPHDWAGSRLKDGGIACVLPSAACRSLGAEFIIGADVWELSYLLRGIGISPDHPLANRAYPSHYQVALQNSDLLIQPHIPWTGYLYGSQALERMILAGERATTTALEQLEVQSLIEPYTPEGKVSAGSPSLTSATGSSGSTARV